jgi:hypothetical protein
MHNTVNRKTKIKMGVGDWGKCHMEGRIWEKSG